MLMDTYTGQQFDPMQMQEENIFIEDIAHALSLMCRGGGHIRTFYSVAQHSLNCTKEAKAQGYSKRVQLACLLHDASEAYIADIIRPVKAHLSNYLKIEDQIMACIWKQFDLADLSLEEQKAWKKMDDLLLEQELKHLMPGEENRFIPVLASIPDLRQRNWQDVEQEFIQCFKDLHA